MPSGVLTASRTCFLQMPFSSCSWLCLNFWVISILVFLHFQFFAVLRIFFLQGKAVIFLKIIEFLSAPCCPKVVLGMQVAGKGKS